MRKKTIAILIPIIILVLCAASFILPQKDFSERENRYLADFPKASAGSIKNGSFTKGVSDFLGDHFPARDTWIEINTARSRAAGKTLVNQVFFAEDGYLIEKYTENPSAMKKVAEIVNLFNERISSENVTVSFMAVPTSSAINRALLPYGADCGDELRDLAILYEDLNTETIDLTNVLGTANDSFPVFYRLDHHWTSKGANAAAKEYLTSVGTKVMSDSKPLLTATDSFRGTLFNKVGECGIQPDIIEYFDCSGINYTYEDENGTSDSIYDFSKLETSDSYAFFLYGNHPKAKIINNDNPAGKKILIIKDSYANSLVPFLIPYYSEIKIIDPRYFGESVSDIVNTEGFDEVLFIYNMNMLGTDTGIRRVK